MEETKVADLKLKQQLLRLKKQLQNAWDKLSDSFSSFDYSENESFWDTKGAEDLGGIIEDTILEIDSFIESDLKKDK